MFSLISLCSMLATSFCIHQNQKKHTLLHPTPRDSDSVCLGWDLRICSSNKFPGDAAGGPHCSLAYTVPSLIHRPQQCQNYLSKMESWSSPPPPPISSAFKTIIPILLSSLKHQDWNQLSLVGINLSLPNCHHQSLSLPTSLLSTAFFYYK